MRLHTCFCDTSIRTLEKSEILSTFQCHRRSELIIIYYQLRPWVFPEYIRRIDMWLELYLIVAYFQYNLWRQISISLKRNKVNKAIELCDYEGAKSLVLATLWTQ